jgi:signal transduction histidine kinase
LDDIRTHPRAVGTPPGHPPVRAFLGVPLSFRGKALGSLFVGNGPSGGSFSGGDRELLMAFAAQAALAIEHARLYQRSRQLARLEERKRIAQSLHETVAQYLFTIGLEAEKCLEQHCPCEETMVLVQRLADKANEELRSAVFTLSMDTSFTRESLSTILTELVEEFEKVSGVKSLLILPRTLPRIPFRVKEAMYRIVREALTNVRKHAHATMAAVTVSYEGDRLSVAIQDDGTGFRLKDDGSIHFGLLTMEQLASNAGGEITISNNDDVGTVVRVSFPLTVSDREESDGEPSQSADCR